MALGIWEFNATRADDAGIVRTIPGAQVTVRRESDGELAPLFLDVGGGSPLSNPFEADAAGGMRFYAPSGARYRIEITNGTLERTLRHQAVSSAVGGALEVTPQDFGAVGNGTADDRAAINDAIDAVAAAGGGVVHFPPGVYLVGSEPGVVIKAGVVLRGSGMASVLRQGWWPSATVAGFRGFMSAAGAHSDVDVAALTSDAVPGGNAIAVASAAALVVGGWYLLGADRPFGNAAESVAGDHIRYAGEVVRIAAIDGTTVTFAGFIRDFYDVADDASLRAISYLDGVGLRDLRISNPEPETSSSGLVEFLACRGFVVENVAFEDADGPGLNLDMCREGSISACRFSDFADDPSNIRFGYGINFVRATENITVTGCGFRRLRHAVTTNGVHHQRGVPRNITVSGCAADLMSHHAFDTHAQGSNFLFAGNEASNTIGGAGFHIRSQDTRVIGNSVGWCREGVVVGPEADGAEIRGNIIRNTVRIGDTGGSGITLTGPRRVKLATNTIEGCTQYGIFIAASSDYPVIQGNIIANPGTGGAGFAGIRIADDAEVVGALILGNDFVNFDVASDEPLSTGNMPNAIWLGTLTSGAIVRGNRSVGQSQAVVLDDGTDNQVVAPTAYGEQLLTAPSAPAARALLELRERHAHDVTAGTYTVDVERSGRAVFLFGEGTGVVVLPNNLAGGENWRIYCSTLVTGLTLRIAQGARANFGTGNVGSDDSDTDVAVDRRAMNVIECESNIGGTAARYSVFQLLPTDPAVARDVIGAEEAT